MHNKLETFKYTYIDNKASKTLFLLHGTGGDEQDFLFLDELLGKKYNFVGLRGNVQEKGMNRFFRRISEGAFDQESIKEEAGKLGTFIRSWMDEFNVTANDLAFLGYSNGANMLCAMLFYYPQLIKNLVLLHPMLPFEPEISESYSDTKAFVSIGLQDHMISPAESRKLVDMLERLGVECTVKEYDYGHGITEQEVEDIVKYLLHSS